MWNSKVKCKKAYKSLDGHGFCEGNTYKVVDGKLIFPNREESSVTYNCIEELNEGFYAVFEEAKN